MKGRRGFTMIELTITVALTAMVVGVVASMYSFVAIRLSDSYTQSMVTDQVNDVADRIEATIRNATNCTTLDSATTLVCAMPKNGVDLDADGHFDAYYPDGVDANNNPKYTVGRYYWFFQASSGGQYKSNSTGMIWRADSTSNTALTSADNDLPFMYYPPISKKKLRNNLVPGVTYVIDSAKKTVTFTLTGGTRMGGEDRDTSHLAASRVFTITRTVQWRD